MLLKPNCRLESYSAATLQIAFLLLLGAVPGLANDTTCATSIPVYDPFGTKLDFVISRISPETRPDVDLLSVAPRIMKAVGHRILIYDTSVFGRTVLSVILENRDHKKIEHKVFPMSCGQRTSIRFCQSEAAGDFEYVSIRGRVVGCHFADDWWVRAEPMFGPSTSPGPAEATIAKDGSFILSGQMSGERHILVIGKGKVPVAVTAFNLTIGVNHEPLLIDVTGKCPAD